MIALPLWVAIAGIAIVADVLFLQRVSQWPTPSFDQNGVFSGAYTGLRWLACVMLVPCAWLLGTVLVGCRLARRPVEDAVPVLAWTVLVPAPMLLMLLGLRAFAAPFLLLLVLHTPAMAAFLLWLHTRGWAVPAACAGACLPAALVFLSVDIESGLGSAAAPMVWMLIVSLFVLHNAAVRAVRRPTTERMACPRCGYRGEFNLGSPCPSCGEFADPA